MKQRKMFSETAEKALCIPKRLSIHICVSSVDPPRNSEMANKIVRTH